MKYFYGINKKDDPNNTSVDGKEFAVERVSDEYIDKRNAIIDSIADKIGIKNLAPSKVSSFFFTLSMLVSIIAIIVIIRVLSSGKSAFIESEELLGKHIWLPLVTVAAVSYFLYFLVKLVKSIKAINYDTASAELERLNALNGEILESMGVPANAFDIDVFCAQYKDGERIKNEDKCDFANYAFKLYRDEKNLYIFDGENKYRFELSSLAKIHTVNEKVMLFKWNKETYFDTEEYAEYKVSDEENACISIPTYHILELNHGGESWGIYFGNYDLVQIEELTGLKK